MPGLCRVYFTPTPIRVCSTLLACGMELSGAIFLSTFTTEFVSHLLQDFASLYLQNTPCEWCGVSLGAMFTMFLAPL